MIIAGALLALLPFVVFVGATSYSVVNGEITSYSYFNLAAIAGGIAAVGVGFALVRRDHERGGLRPPRWVILVGVLVALLGVFQIVRGVGVLPGLTGCTSETGSAGFCKTTSNI